MLSVSLIRCKNEALIKLYFKNIIKCFKRVQIDKWPDLPYLFSLIYCCIRIKSKPDHLSKIIFSHRFCDSDCINFKTFAFLAVYWSIWTSLYNTDIEVQPFLKSSLHSGKQWVCLHGLESRSERRFKTRSKTWLGLWFELRLFTWATNAFPITIRICALRVMFCSYYAVRARWLTHALMHGFSAHF